MTKLPITPETKVGDLLDAYPELEAVLIGMAPAFAKLKNPILRKTVARVASLAQAAKVGGIPARLLVTRLRQEAGLEPAAEAAAVSDQDDSSLELEPEWVRSSRIVENFDADSMLAQGLHPIAQIMPRIASLKVGEQVQIRATFDPAPLTDMLKSKGSPTYTKRHEDGSTVTFVGAPSEEVGQ